MADEKQDGAMQENGSRYLIADLMPEIDDQFQNLKDAVVMRRAKDPRLGAIIVTAESHGDGATMIAVNLALTLARDGKSKVLLVDGDLRRPVLHSLFSTGNGAGFFDALMGKADAEKAVRETLRPRVSVLPGGGAKLHPSQVNMDKLDAILAQLKKTYDYLIFNSSPVNKYSDSVVLAAHLDAAILVMRAETTNWDGLERAKRQLEQKGVPILGIVMNRRKYYIPRFLYRRFIV